MFQAYFDNIENQIAACVSLANKRVYVAVAWFTNQALFNYLLTVLERKVEVKVLLLDDILNRSEFGLDFGMLESCGAEVCFAESTKGLMHNKFCIIDDKVITGSYNWTYHANKNDENIIISDDVELVANYCKQFDSLFYVGKRIQLPYEHLKWPDIKEKDFSEFERNIYNDVVANEKDYYKELKRDKLKALDRAYKSANQQDLNTASKMPIKRPLRAIMDVLTNRYQDFELKLWKENIMGKPLDNVDGYDKIERWYYIPCQIKEDKYHQECVNGVLKTFSSRHQWLAKGLDLNIYDKEFVAMIKECLKAESSTRINRELFLGKMLQIENAKLFFYPFPCPMYNKNGMPRIIKAINVFGIVKSMDGDKITFYEGWDPNERGKKIEEKYFRKD